VSLSVDNVNFVKVQCPPFFSFGFLPLIAICFTRGCVDR
jgi:hypothetical protein